jgi:hypothetical protein
LALAALACCLLRSAFLANGVFRHSSGGKFRGENDAD